MALVTRTVPKAPFPYFGGKRHIAALVWRFLGYVNTYVEPFAGSLAVLLACPRPAVREYANDLDGLVANFWRSVQQSPDEVAAAMVGPVTHHDVNAWRRFLLAEGDDLSARLLADPRYFEAELAGRWAWATSASIDGTEPFVVRPSWAFQGALRGVDPQEVCRALAQRLENVRFYCCDWQAFLSKSLFGYLRDRRVGVFLDPPYDQARRAPSYRLDSQPSGIESWCKENENDVRIVLAGLDDEYDLPGWHQHRWRRRRGMEREENKRFEVLWVSPGCESQLDLFGVA